jgi:hypothetical protein
MLEQQSLKKWAIPVLLFVVGFGLISGCGKGEQADIAESQGSEMAEEQTMQEHEPMGMEQGQTFEATLSGSNEVPAVTTDAEGTFSVTLESDSIHVQGDFSGLSSEFAASHIHQGGPNENGPPIITLEPTLGADNLSGSWDTTYSVNSSQIEALKSDSLYVNVHSTQHQAGEIRGQLTSGRSGM